MRIGIDISQLAYPNTGVANYLKNLVHEMVEQNHGDEFILFFSSLRGRLDNSFISELTGSKVTVKTYKYPPKLLDLLWNRLHIMPIERFVGDVDIFITSDWTEPPTKKAKKATIIYDMVVYKFPNETAQIIREVQKRKNSWVKKETSLIFTISESAKKDIVELLEVEESKVKVIYPGI